MNACSAAWPRDFHASGGDRSFARSILLLLGAMLMLLTGGCATTGAPYAPESSLTAREDLAALKKHFATATSIENYFAVDPVTKRPIAETKEARNRFIAGRLVLYDLAYADWISRFRFGRAAESTILDTASLGISQAIALIGGVETKEALGAIGGAILGTRSSYEKNFYDEQTAAAITAQMNAERKAALIPIMAGIRSEIDDYPLTAALVDLTNYQHAGTIDGALAGIQREAGNKAEEAEDALATFRSDKFDPDESTDRIWKWLFLGMSSRRADGQPIDANGNPITDMDTSNKNALIAEIARLTSTRPNEIPFQHFIENSKYKELRKQAVNNLRIP